MAHLASAALMFKARNTSRNSSPSPCPEARAKSRPRTIALEWILMPLPRRLEQSISLLQSCLGRAPSYSSSQPRINLVHITMCGRSNSEQHSQPMMIITSLQIQGKGEGNSIETYDDCRREHPKQSARSKGKFLRFRDALLFVCNEEKIVGRLLRHTRRYLVVHRDLRNPLLGLRPLALGFFPPDDCSRGLPRPPETHTCETHLVSTAGSAMCRVDGESGVPSLKPGKKTRAAPLLGATLTPRSLKVVAPPRWQSLR